jgi:excinuclease UvrABC nuclease subunit
MKWDNRDGRDYRVVASSGWTSLTNYSNLEARAGVYLFADSSLQIKYIGKAGAGRIASEVGNAIRRGKGRGASQVRALYTNSDANALSLESSLIAKYDPINNKT